MAQQQQEAAKTKGRKRNKQNVRNNIEALKQWMVDKGLPKPRKVVEDGVAMPYFNN